MSQHVVSEHQAQPVTAAANREIAHNTDETDHTELTVREFIPIQFKLSLGSVDDPLEAEADQMADRVMRMPEGSDEKEQEQRKQATQIQRKCSACAEVQVQRMHEDGNEEEHVQQMPAMKIQRKCAACEEEKVQRMPEGDNEDEQVQRKPATKIQRKCAACEEEKVQRMPEGDGEDEQVLRMSATKIQRKCAACEEEHVQRMHEESKDEEQLQRRPQMPFLQRKESGPTAVDSGTAREINSSRGGGSPMDRPVQSFMESRFNADFSSVRIHDNQQAAGLSSSLQAQAFTVGNDIYFNQGKYAPGTDEGKHLLAHELTHTLQQSGGSTAVQRRTIPQDFATAAYPTGPVWDVHLVVTGAPGGTTDSVTDFINACHDGIMGAANTLGTRPSVPGRNIRVCIRYRRIRANSGDYADVQQEAYRLALASVLGPAPAPAPTPPPSTPAPTPPTPAPRGPLTVLPCPAFPITIGSRGGCGTGDDATTTLFPLSAVPSSLAREAAALDALPDFMLRVAPQGVLSTAGAPEGYSLFNDFYNSTASSRTFGVGTDVSTRAQAHPDYIRNRGVVSAGFITNLDAQATAANQIDCSAITLPTTPAYNFSGSFDIKLWTLIGGTQGTVIELTGMTIDPAARTYTASVRFTICDDFGVDTSDLSRTGVTGTMLNELLLPFWILQHRRSGHTPLVINVVVEDTISGPF
ncbi:protein of unknown function [Chitinophaga jiangningensis]|uniref:eCIS core domain-containing protein n=1 Tax=Chitinophaga jiangningensis TaxID=1419482 RepID=A0A1M7INV2_9BACT|nr:DUF4157 domain-containing protein [Chitinophaga jiangningensis]SHM42365.1 protein of unknown function [Chitinophaga jiangningensis]